MSEYEPRQSSQDVSFGVEVTANSLDHLRRSRLFDGVDREMIEQLAPAFRLERVAKGAMLDLAETPERAVAVIRRGRVAAELRVGKACRIVVSRLEAGDVLGIEALFDATAASRLRAVSETVLLTISIQQLRPSLSRSCELARNVAQALAQRLDDTASALAELAYAERAHHVVAALVRVSQQFGVAVADGVLLDVALGQSDVAEIAACTEPDAARALALLEREGFLRINGSSIVLLTNTRD